MDEETLRAVIREEFQREEKRFAEFVIPYIKSLRVRFRREGVPLAEQPEESGNVENERVATINGNQDNAA